MIPPAPAPDVAIRLDGVRKAFGRRKDVVVLDEVSLDIPSGRFVAVLGPSGCGKTTLLRLIDGLVTPDAGTLTVGGCPPRPGPAMGFIFQSFRLVPWMTVRENVAFGLGNCGLPGVVIDERTQRALDAVGLGGFASVYPAALSGGMKQRVAMARAFAPEPSVLLLDEPFASLDAQTRTFMQAELTQLWRRRRATTVLVTHSVDEALLLADEVVLMGSRPGRVLERLTVPRPQPGRAECLQQDADLARLHLGRRIHELVTADPRSEFFGRDVLGRNPGIAPDQPARW